MVITPHGIVSRYLYGITFLPADIQMALTEAAAGMVRPTIARILALCYSYDPQGRRYVVNVTRLTGAAVLLFAAGFILFLVKGKPASNNDRARLSR